MAAFMEWWRRRSRKAKIWLIVGAVVALFALIAAVSPSEESNDGANPPAATPQPEPEPPPPEPPPPPPAPPPAPRPVVLNGSGARVVSLRLAKDSPAILHASHRGSSNFVVELFGPGESDLLVNEIGNYGGQVPIADAAAGRYRVKVGADGRWSLRFTQPVPTPRARKLPGAISGRGPRVIPIRTVEDLQPIIDVRHRGRSNFVVEIIGYGDTSGSELLVNEIGNYSGQTLIDELSAGPYLLAVQADGPWTIKFSP